VVQTRRSALGDPGKAVLGALNMELGHDYKQPDYPNQVWLSVVGRYNESLIKGRGLWNKLEAERTTLASDPSGLSTTLSAVRADYDRRYKNHYLSSVTRDEAEGTYITHSSSYLTPQERPEKPKETIFHSRIILPSNTLEIVHHYADRDAARIRDAQEAGKPLEERDQGYQRIGLASSEILWRQFLDVARDQFILRKDARARALATQIASVVVMQSVNVRTGQVVFVAYPDGEIWKTHDRTWTPEATEEEFKAILGTPNVAPAIYLLLDHLDEIGDRSIASITTRGGDDRIIDINFTPAPPAPTDHTTALVMVAILAALAGAGYFFW
jgi:hypothetical protein